MYLHCSDIISVQFGYYTQGLRNSASAKKEFRGIPLAAKTIPLKSRDLEIGRIPLADCFFSGAFEITVPVFFRQCSDRVPVLFRYYTGTVPVRFRYCSGPV